MWNVRKQSRTILASVLPCIMWVTWPCTVHINFHQTEFIDTLWLSAFEDCSSARDWHQINFIWNPWNMGTTMPKIRDVQIFRANHVVEFWVLRLNWSYLIRLVLKVIKLPSNGYVRKPSSQFFGLTAIRSHKNTEYHECFNNWRFYTEYSGPALELWTWLRLFSFLVATKWMCIRNTSISKERGLK